MIGRKEIDMEDPNIIYEKHGRVAVITLNRPRTLNALNREMLTTLSSCIKDTGKDEDVRSVILTGAEGAFSTGLDVEELLSEQVKEPPLPIMDTYAGTIFRGEPSPMTIVLDIRAMDKPVIAAINGMTAGVAFCFALACDIRIASEEARFNIGFVRRGLVPDMGGTYLLPRLVGCGHASEIMLTGDTLEAREAERVGLVNRVVRSEELMERAREIACKIADNPPLAVKSIKQAIVHGLETPDLATHMEYEFYLNGFLNRTEDFREGVRSFMEKRKPVFKGR
jgi:2-(1,2-epoxy-1,2-dihydrophenyl)acetyl-CoA isomerase